jgi:hypothetical protein
MSICAGLDEIIDQFLGIAKIGSTAPHYHHKKSCLHLTNRPFTLDGATMLATILEKVEENWRLSSLRNNRSPSPKNWRWEKQAFVSGHNTSPEKTLEKRLVQVTDDNWINQVPAASGLFDDIRDKHRSVDLVSRSAPGGYHFYELKVASGTPLLGAVECVIYGVLYVFARLHFPQDHIRGSEILRARRIDLAVLAPRQYYDGYNLGWLARDLSQGFASVLAARNLSLSMELTFVQFPGNFSWPCDDGALLRALTQREEVPWS